MILVPVLVLFLPRLVASESAGPELLPPGDVELLEGALLSWSLGDDGAGVVFTVQSWRSGLDRWKDVSSCVRIPASPCDVSALLRGAGPRGGAGPQGGAEPDCVMLRVKGHRGRDESEAVEACTRENSTCTPQVRLSVLPGSLTVHLSRSRLWEEHADHAKHQVCVWRQGRQGRQGRRERTCQTSVFSQTFEGLEEGRTYCVSVRYVVMDEPVGTPRCPVCLAVPRAPSRHAWALPAVALPVAAVVLGLVVAYVVLFHKERIKVWFKPAPTPRSLRPRPLNLPPEGALLCTPPDEPCARITGFTQLNQD